MAQHHVVSVSHIDMAFVMRKEAQAEMVEILLERIIRVLERHPQLHFALEQAAHYRNLEHRRPDLFEKVRELLQTGRLEFMGGMATTAETNFPNGECLIRNQGMGLNWVREHLGVTPHSGWMVDTFGLNPQVPQIMEQFGFKYLHANRFGGNKTRDLFQAEGLNGSRVVIIGCDSASINVNPETQALFFCRSWADVDTLFSMADRLEGELPKLVTYYIENEEVFSEYYLKLTEDRQKTGDWRHSTYKAYMDALERNGYVPPVVKEDLNPEFTGTFALRTPIKTENRKAENDLLAAESFYALLNGSDGDLFEDAWWELFHCQFHDAFTGSHEDITNRNLLDSFAAIQSASRETLSRTLQLEQSENSLTVCNPLPWERTCWASIPALRQPAGVFDGERKLLSCEKEGRLYFQATLPSLGFVNLTLREETENIPPQQSPCREIRNDYFRLVLNERNGIERLEDAQGKVYMENAGDFLIAEEDRGGMQISCCDGRMRYASRGSIRVEDAWMDALGQHIAMGGTFPTMPWNRQNRLEWRMEFSLYRGERMLRTKITLNWEGDSTRIRLRLPLAICGRDFYNEVPFGVVRREAYRNLPTAKGAWPAQRWAALEDGEAGVALLNRGVAGVEQEGNIICTTLIRAYGNGPDAWVKPTALSSQNGVSTFEFAIVPYRGNYRDGDILRLAQEFDREAICFRGRCPLTWGGSPLLELEGKGIFLSAVKRAWDGSGDLIVRLYESQGCACDAKLRVPGWEFARAVNLKEEPVSGSVEAGEGLDLHFAPYEIKTIRYAQKL